MREDTLRITITLNDHDRQQLEATFTTTADRRLRDRCQALLMADRGRRHQHLAEDLRVSPRTLQRWLHAYRTGGRDGLTIQWAPGRTPLSPEALAPEMVGWVKHGPAGCGLGCANWPAAALATYLYHQKGIAVSERTMRAFCTRHGVRPSRPTSQSLKGDPAEQAAARQELTALKKAQASDLVLLSQDEARFSMIPTLRPTLGVKGHRPVVGKLDCHDVLSVFGALNLVMGRLTTRLVARPRQPKPVRSTQRSLPEAFSRHRRDITRAYPAEHYPWVVLVGDKASWHQGALGTAVLADCPHLELYPLPSSSPKLQVLERFWKVLRRQATHHRLLPTMAQLRRALRNSLCYYQTLKHRVLSVIQSPRKGTKSSAA
jgi:transposase